MGRKKFFLKYLEIIWTELPNNKYVNVNKLGISTVFPTNWRISDFTHSEHSYFWICAKLKKKLMPKKSPEKISN